MLFQALLLRAENQQIENAEDENERKEKAQNIAAASACGLGECRSNHQRPRGERKTESASRSA
jgi:hypothetical protein